MTMIAADLDKIYLSHNVIDVVLATRLFKSSFSDSFAIHDTCRKSAVLPFIDPIARRLDLWGYWNEN